MLRNEEWEKGAETVDRVVREGLTEASHLKEDLYVECSR